VSGCDGLYDLDMVCCDDLLASVGGSPGAFLDKSR
jgi:hypothetical protein